MKVKVELHDAERHMLDVARQWGWHTLSSAEEYEAAARLARRGLGTVHPGLGGHAGSFRPRKTGRLR